MHLKFTVIHTELFAINAETIGCLKKKSFAGSFRGMCFTPEDPYLVSFCLIS